MRHSTKLGFGPSPAISEQGASMNRRIHFASLASLASLALPAWPARPRHSSAIGLAILLAGCGASGAPNSYGDGGDGGATQTTGAGATGGGSNAGGGSTGGAGGGSAGGTSSGGGSTTTTGAGGTGGASSTTTSNTAAGGAGGATTGSTATTTTTCGALSSTAQQIPLDMFIMLDQSGSMDGGKWTSVTSALKTFVQQPDAVGIGVGLQYFGLPSGGSCPLTCKTNTDCGACGPCMFGVCLGSAGGDSCNSADYAKAEVGIAPLPGVAQPIIDSMAKHSPSTGTPTYPALDGAITYSKAWATQNPTHAVITVLATDGDPSGCNEDMNAINALAAAGASGTPKILTFVIGVGSSLTALNGIAKAGGTDQAFLVDTGQNVDQQFLDAMNAIRGAALGCTYLIPPPKPGESVDYNKVNVIYTPGDGTPAQTLGKVNGEANCPPGGDGWYYNDELNPSTILLCESTCSKVAADSKGQVDVAVGCLTQHQ
jgi:hypothetical protein